VTEELQTWERAQRRIDSIVEAVGGNVRAQSAVGDGLCKVLHALVAVKPECCVEVGTLRGLSAVALAHFCGTVITIDVERQPELRQVLSLCPRHIRDRICPVIIPDNDAKAALIQRLDFQFAYIDGGHTEGQVALDFALTRRCGRVLFHDYPASGSGCDGVKVVLDKVTDGVVEPRVPFAWWRAE
jgi:predicted O-methyltransferase YrrM